MQIGRAVVVGLGPGSGKGRSTNVIGEFIRTTKVDTGMSDLSRLVGLTRRSV